VVSFGHLGDARVAGREWEEKEKVVEEFHAKARRREGGGVIYLRLGAFAWEWVF